MNRLILNKWYFELLFKARLLELHSSYILLMFCKLLLVRFLHTYNSSFNRWITWRKAVLITFWFYCLRSNVPRLCLQRSHIRELKLVLYFNIFIVVNYRKDVEWFVHSDPFVFKQCGSICSLFTIFYEAQF